MREDIRFTVWVHRQADSIFGSISRPVTRDGLMLSFNDEQRAHAECARLNEGLGDTFARYSVEKELTVRA